MLMSKKQKIICGAIILLIVLASGFLIGRFGYRIKQVETRVTADSVMFSEEIFSYDTTIVALDRKLERSQAIIMEKIKSDSQSFKESINSLGKQIRKTTKQSKNNSKRLSKLEKKTTILDKQMKNNIDSVKAREQALLLILNSQIQETTEQLTTRLDSVTEEVVIVRKSSSNIEETNKKLHWRKRR